MKDTYSSNCDDPIVANERLKNKLDFLQRQSSKRQIYLKDIQKSIKLKNETIKSLTNSKQGQRIHQTILSFQKQNQYLQQKLKQQYQGICRLNALYLMQCQLRIEQNKSFNQRIIEFENSISELRRYLHDKQQSFSCVVEKLKKYQDLGDDMLCNKVRNYGAIFLEDTSKDVLKRLVEDQERQKGKAQELQEKCKKLEVLAYGLNNHANFYEFKTYVESLNQVNLQKVSSIISQGEKKNETNLSTNLSYPQVKKADPNIQLIRLMKKQKLTNRILQSALNEGIEKNIELLQCNRRLGASNIQLRRQVDEIIAEMVILCESVKRYDDQYRTRLRILKHRARDDSEIQSYREILQKYRFNEVQEAKEILFNRMRSDLEEMGEFVAFCQIQKTNNIPAYESPGRLYAAQRQDQNSEIQQQFSISEI